MHCLASAHIHIMDTTHAVQVQSSKVHESPTWGTKTNRIRQSKLLKKFPELVHKKDVHVHKERKQLICRVEVEANFSMVCT